jgi:hypothetical protein
MVKPALRPDVFGMSVTSAADPTDASEIADVPDVDAGATII